MLLKVKWSLMLSIIATIGFLSACNNFSEDNLVGSWKSVVDGDTQSYFEIAEERIIIRSSPDSNPITAEYILTDTQNDNFIVEIINPESGNNEFLFEGYFENNNTIALVDIPGNSSENIGLIRIDNIEEEREQEEQAEEEREQEEQAEEEREQEEQAEEEREQEEQGIESSEVEVKQSTDQVNNLSIDYMEKADNLEERIMEEAKKIYAHDMALGFYGQYYEEWDMLLNEVWGVLKDTLPSDIFETLRLEQIEWIESKEQNFAEINDEVASERSRGMDELAHETKNRTYYLIENHMN